MEGIFSKYLSRNYHLALLVLFAGIAALFTHRLSGGEFVALATAVVTTFRVGDAFVNWIHRDSEGPK